MAEVEMKESNEETSKKNTNKNNKQKAAKTRIRGKRKIGIEHEKERKKEWHDCVNRWKELINNKNYIREMKRAKNSKINNNNRQRNTTQHNEWFGERIGKNNNWPIPHKDGILRIKGQNVNGISRKMDYGEWEVILESLDERQVDIACLSEINLALDKPEVKYTLREKAKKMDKNIHLNMTCSKTNLTDSTYKRGGVMTITRGTGQEE